MARVDVTGELAQWLKEQVEHHSAKIVEFPSGDAKRGQHASQMLAFMETEEKLTELLGRRRSRSTAEPTD